VVLPRNIGRGVILDENTETVTSATADKLVRYRLADGDVVCPRTGTLGRYGLVRPGQAGWILGPSCMRIRPGLGVDPRYLTSYLNGSAAVRWVADRESAAAVIQHISATTMGELPLALPALEVQREIADRLEVLEDRAALYGRLAEASGVLATSMAESMLPRPAEGPRM
jgi:type I restriction enzyme M protein